MRNIYKILTEYESFNIVYINYEYEKFQKNFDLLEDHMKILSSDNCKRYNEMCDLFKEMLTCKNFLYRFYTGKLIPFDKNRKELEFALKDLREFSNNNIFKEFWKFINDGHYSKTDIQAFTDKISQRINEVTLLNNLTYLLKISQKQASISDIDENEEEKYRNLIHAQLKEITNNIDDKINTFLSNIFSRSIEIEELSDKE